MTKTIIIIGSGCSGTAAAMHLMLGGCRHKIVLIDNSPESHRGLAYSTTDMSHLLNVPAGRISIISGRPDHFLEWLKRNDANAAADTFAARFLYGCYLNETFEEIKQGCNCEVEIIKDNARSVTASNGRFNITLEDGNNLAADKVVLACGWSGENRASVSNTRIIKNPYSLPDQIFTGSNVAIAGSGLTAVDSILTLRDKGFKGSITMISRRGLIPQVHNLKDKPFILEIDSLPRSLSGILKFIRKNSAARIQEGLSWHAVIDSIRPHTQRLWNELTIRERSQFLRHVRPYWETHRHRMAGSISAIVNSELESGKLKILPANILSLDEGTSDVKISIRRRGSYEHEILSADFVISAMGAKSIDNIKRGSIINSLESSGLAARDKFNLGINCNASGQVLDKNGDVSEGLYVLGPLSQGSLWESTAVPEIVRTAKAIADQLTDL